MTASVSADFIKPVVPEGGRQPLVARVIGILRSPRTTLDAVAAEPRWGAVLALTFVVSLVSSALLLETEVGQLALIDQWERTAVAFGQTMDDTQYAALVEASEHGVAYAVLSSFASGPLLTAAVAALLFVIFTVGMRGTVTYRQVLAVVAHAGVIIAVRQVIAAPVNYARETLASPTAASFLFTMLDEASPIARFLGAIDLFVVWWITVLALGIALLYGHRARPLVFIFIGAYVALALVLAVVMAVTGGTA